MHGTLCCRWPHDMERTQWMNINARAATLNGQWQEQEQALKLDLEQDSFARDHQCNFESTSTAAKKLFSSTCILWPFAAPLAEGHKFEKITI